MVSPRRPRKVIDPRNDPNRGFMDAFGDAVGEGREDWSRAYRANRRSQGLDENAPRWNEMMGSHPTATRVNEAIHAARASRDPNYAQSTKAKQIEREMLNRSDLGIGRENSGNGRQAGQILGTIANDVVNDTSRGIYWLLNAMQATTNVIGESTLGRANPALYGRHKLKGPNGEVATLKQNGDYLKAQGYIAEDGTPRSGVQIEQDGTVSDRNFKPGHVASLLVPAGIAVNSGLGLMTPFGGAEGYYAVNPSQEDPTKTANVIDEVAQKYIMGKTGNLLPYDEFVKVRPDVSPSQYGQYKGYKYDNDLDYNPMDDGDMVLLPGGALKASVDGIHGPEVSILGRALPFTTGIVPFASSVGLAALGVRTGRPIRNGMIGGTAGLAAGTVVGNLLEAERRRRNLEANNIRDDSQGIV